MSSKPLRLGKSIIVSAPSGAGKTTIVLWPFRFQHAQEVRDRWSKMERTIIF